MEQKQQQHNNSWTAKNQTTNQSKYNSENYQENSNAAPPNIQQKLQPKLQKTPIVLKYLLIGPAASGKSCLLLSYTQNTFFQTYISTIGVDFKIKQIQYNNEVFKLQIWDTAGQQRFRTITSSYYKGANCFYLIYDCTDLGQFKNILLFLKQIEKFGSSNRYICLVGTKCDLIDKKVVTTQMGMQIAQQNKIDFMQVSAIRTQQFSKKLDQLFMKGIFWYIQNLK